MILKALNPLTMTSIYLTRKPVIKLVTDSPTVPPVAVITISPNLTTSLTMDAYWEIRNAVKTANKMPSIAASVGDLRLAMASMMCHSMDASASAPARGKATVLVRLPAMVKPEPVNLFIKLSPLLLLPKRFSMTV